MLRKSDRSIIKGIPYVIKRSPPEMSIASFLRMDFEQDRELLILKLADDISDEALLEMTLDETTRVLLMRILLKKSIRKNESVRID